MMRLKAMLLVTTLFTLSACIDSRVGYRDFGDSYTDAREQFVGSVYFATASSTLSKAAQRDLAQIGVRLQERRFGGQRIVIVGYADRKRGVEENAELASERAQRVALALEKRGIDLDRLVIDSRSIRLTKPQSGERRVDIFFASGSNYRLNNYYPILIAFFLLVTFAVAALVFRRRRN